MDLSILRPYLGPFVFGNSHYSRNRWIRPTSEANTDASESITHMILKKFLTHLHVYDDCCCKLLLVGIIIVASALIIIALIIVILYDYCYSYHHCGK